MCAASDPVSVNVSVVAWTPAPSPPPPASPICVRCPSPRPLFPTCFPRSLTNPLCYGNAPTSILDTHPLLPGGFATVYLARLAPTNLPVALKVFKAFTSQHDVLSFVGEVQMLAGLNHPHILQYLGVVSIDGKSAGPEWETWGGRGGCSCHRVDTLFVSASL